MTRPCPPPLTLVALLLFTSAASAVQGGPDDSRPP